MFELIMLCLILAIILALAEQHMYEKEQDNINNHPEINQEKRTPRV